MPGLYAGADRFHHLKPKVAKCLSRPHYQMTMFLTQSQKISFLEKVFGEGRFSNGGLNMSVQCPVCKKNKKTSYTKKKLVIRTDNFICHCWVCGFKARSPMLLIKNFFPNYYKEYVGNFANLNSSLVNEEDERETRGEEGEGQTGSIFLPVGFRLLALETNKENMSWFEKSARRYLKNTRGTSDDDLWYWKFGISEEEEDLDKRVILPSFDSEGNVNYWTARTIDNRQKPKYLNPNIPRENVIFNEININWSKPLTLTEGPFDLFKCNKNATCLLGSELTEKYKLFQKIVENQTPIVLALDADAKRKSFDIVKKIMEYGNEIKYIDVPVKYGDVGAMTKSIFGNLLTNAVKITNDNFLSMKIKFMLNEGSGSN